MNKFKVLPINALKFLRGSPVDVINNTVVLEQWATWCPPCVQSIPHLNQLAKTYPKIPFVGVSNEPEAKVLKGIETYKMEYTVAVDTEGVLDPYNDYFQVRGIPHAFVIHDNQVVYSGHPMDPAFEQTVSKLHESK